MPRHFEQRWLPHPPPQLFLLVGDIERYPEFLPWCLEARVRNAPKKGALEADLVVGYKAFRETFSSIVTLEEQKSIKVEYQSGPLSYLTNEWHFKQGVNNGCNLTFFVDFAFRSKIFGTMMDMFFDKAFCKMVAAFEARAQQLYGNQIRYDI